VSEGKKSFILYCDITDDLLVSVAFEPIKQQLKRDLDKYKIVVNRNKENGKKGGRPKKEETQTNPEKPILILILILIL